MCIKSPVVLLDESGLMCIMVKKHVDFNGFLIP